MTICGVCIHGMGQNKSNGSLFQMEILTFSVSFWQCYRASRWCYYLVIKPHCIFLWSIFLHRTGISHLGRITKGTTLQKYRCFVGIWRRVSLDIKSVMHSLFPLFSEKTLIYFEICAKLFHISTFVFHYFSYRIFGVLKYCGFEINLVRHFMSISVHSSSLTFI